MSGNVCYNEIGLYEFVSAIQRLVGCGIEADLEQRAEANCYARFITAWIND